MSSDSDSESVANMPGKSGKSEVRSKNRGLSAHDLEVSLKRRREKHPEKRKKKKKKKMTPIVSSSSESEEESASDGDVDEEPVELTPSLKRGILNSAADVKQFLRFRKGKKKYSSPYVRLPGHDDEPHATVVIDGKLQFDAAFGGDDGGASFEIPAGHAHLNIEPNKMGSKILKAIASVGKAHCISKRLSKLIPPLSPDYNNFTAKYSKSFKKNGKKAFEDTKLTSYEATPKQKLSGEEAKKLLVSGTSLRVILRVAWLLEQQDGSRINLQIRRIFIKKVAKQEEAEDDASDFDDLA